MGVPNVFGSATTSIPLSQLDQNFNTPVTIGSTTVGLGNTTTTLAGLSNVSTTLLVATTANVTTQNVTTSNLTNLTVTNDASISGLTVGKGGGAVASNTAIGLNALKTNSTGASSVAIGQDALQANTTASNNTAVGYQAGYSNTTGTRMTTIGGLAGSTNTTGNYCVYVGYATGQASTGSGNTFVGDSAGLACTGSSNVFVGPNNASAACGSAVTTGSKNTILGGYSGNQGGLDIRTASNYIVLSDGDGNPRQVIDSSGNVGIGTASPNNRLQVLGTIKVATGNAQGIIGLGEANGSTINAGIWRGAANAPTTDGNFLNFGGYDGLVFATGAAVIGSQTERMRIDSSGNLLVGTTSQLYSGKECVQYSSNTGRGLAIYDSTIQNNSTFVAFLSGTSTAIGSITANGTSNVAYNTSSDYRLKENIAPMQNALNVVQQLKPVTYNWKVDGSDGQGFIAHELQAVVPDCVTGEKDAVDAEGNPVYQGIDTSFLVATLTAAIQEQQTLIKDLTTRLTALEGK